MAAVFVACLLSGCEPAVPAVVPYEPLELPEDVVREDTALTEQQVKLRSDIVEVPDELVLGETLRYVVELTNESGTPVFLDPCPVYYQAWGESGFSVSRLSYLNCDDAPPEIAPGASLRFAMELPIEDPEAVHVDGSIVWYLGSPFGGRKQDVGASGAIDVVRR
ncbi:MAG TPA: hypothetical protein VEV43_00395 [Actinomycetota bacterium]|nr:hypothetical protein [Actinomycetota bacterium]